MALFPGQPSELASDNSAVLDFPVATRGTAHLPPRDNPVSRQYYRIGTRKASRQTNRESDILHQMQFLMHRPN